jgi:hypothetical protein
MLHSHDPSRSILLLSFHLRLGLSKGLFPVDLPVKINNNNNANNKYVMLQRLKTKVNLPITDFMSTCQKY